MDQPGGKVGHAELKIGDSRAMLADENLNMGAGHASVASIGQSPVSLEAPDQFCRRRIPRRPSHQ
jgi:PhnB protein